MSGVGRDSDQLSRTRRRRCLRVLLAVMPGMRASREDWLALGRDLIARGLGAPLLVVAEGRPG